MSTEFNGVTASVTFLDTRTEDGWDHNAWKVNLRTEGRRMSVTYRTGLGIPGEPTARNVLESLISDARTVEYAIDFEDWAESLGYTDGRKAKQIYRAVVQQTERLQKFLGERYSEFADLEF